MQLSNPFLTDDVILRELGARLARARVDRDVTQKQLAEEAGVSKTTVERIESGASITLPNLVRILRSLDLLDGLETLVPEPTISPVAAAKLQGRLRQRSSGKLRQRTTRSFSWGDEPPKER